MSDATTRRRRPEHRHAPEHAPRPSLELELEDVEDAEYEELGSQLVPYKAPGARVPDNGPKPDASNPDISSTEGPLRAMPAMPAMPARPARPAMPTEAADPQGQTEEVSFEGQTEDFEDLDALETDVPETDALLVPAPPPTTRAMPADEETDVLTDGGEGEAAEEWSGPYGHSKSMEPLAPAPVEPAAPVSVPAREVSLVAKQAYLAGSNALSLINPQLKDEVDELDGLWSAMSEVAVDDFVAYEIDIRAYDSGAFKAEAKAHVEKLKGLQPDTGPGWGGRLKTAAGVVTWALGRLLWNTGGGTLPPWKREQAKAIQPGQMDKSTKNELANAELKAAEDTHFEVAARLYAGGAPKHSYEHQLHTGTMISKFGHFRTGHQWLDWEDCNALSALHGVLPVRVKQPMVLSAHEVAEMWRVPDDLTRAHGVSLDRSSIEWLEPSNPLVVADPLAPTPGLSPVGLVRVNSDDQAVVAISNASLDRHGLVLGRTGTGKSELYKWLIMGAIKADYPVIVIDPHGQLADGVVRDVIAHAPEHVHRLTFVDTSDPEFPVAINPLDVDRQEQVGSRVKAVQGMMETQFDLSNAPRAQNILFLALTALSEANLVLRARGERLCSVLHVLNFFTDDEFRRLICEVATNISVREYFDPEGSFEQGSAKQQAELYGPIEHRLRRLQGDSLFANSLGASRNKLDWPTLMTEKRIVIVKLALLSEQAEIGAFIGNLLLPMIRNTMMQWGRREDHRLGTTVGVGARVFVDEAPTVLPKDGSAESLLAEARKADVGLVLAAQFLAQYDAVGGPATVKAVVANTASKIVLMQDVASAAPLAKNLGVDAEAISRLPNFHGYISTLSKDGQQGDTYTTRFLPPLTRMAPKVPISDDERMRRYDEVVTRSQDALTNPAAQMRADVLQATARITEALGLILIERTLAPPPPASDPAPAVPVPVPVQPVSATVAPRPVAPQPGSRITGASEAWQFGEFDEFDLEPSE